MKEWLVSQLQKVELAAWLRWLVLVALVAFGAKLGLTPGNTPPLPQAVTVSCGCDQCKCGK